jgi:hypothetical protein
VSVYVFLGSTMTHAEAKAHLDAVYLPPVSQGDVLRLLEDRPRAIGIVDGLFRTVPSVWHKEILVALERGVHVFGAASMGALRAAELSAFGMRGVGRIFERFADGTYEDDDEVAVAHATAEHGYRELGVAMVNLRDAIAQAIDQGLVDRSEGEALARHAKATHYTRRSLDALAHHAKTLWPAEKANALARLFASYGPSLKQRDAVEMLHAMGAFLATDPPAHHPATPVEPTAFLKALRAEALERKKPRRGLDEDASMAAAGVPLWALRKEALTQMLARGAAPTLGVVVSEEELDAVRRRFREGAHIDGAEGEAAWLEREGMTKEMLDTRLRDLVLLQKMEERWAHRVDAELPDLAAVLGAFVAR